MSSIFNNQNIERMRVNGNEIALAKINGNVVFQKNKLLKTFFGDSKQNTTSGKNIFNIYKFASDDSDYYHLENEKLICDSIDSRTQGFVYTPFEQGTYTLSTTNVCNISVHEENSNYLFIQKQNVNSFTFTLEENKNLHFKFFSNDVPYEIGNIQIEKGSAATEYEPYTGGKPSPSPDYPKKISSINGVNLKISNGSKELKIPINLQGNILAKVGDYADELQVYSNGDVKILKKIGKHILNNTAPYIKSTYSTDEYFKGYLTPGIGMHNFTPIANTHFQIGLYTQTSEKETISNQSQLQLQILANRLTENSVSGLQQWLGNNNVIVLFQLINSTTTKVDNIKSELNSFGDYSNIEIETTYS